jgi:tetratricopeptide (TPR) repeat protein
VVVSRLIERLDGAIGSAAEPLRREYLKAERAGALARLGLLADARFALQGLRTQNQRHKDPLLGAWICLVDGQIDHFDTVAPHAQDKFRRALEGARSADNVPMQALASAWLATCAFNASDWAAVCACVSDALRLAEPDEHAARARAGLVLADAYRCSGDDTASQTWYLRARAHASADGDSSMISVMLHNISAMRSGQIALADAFGRADVEQARKALLEAESTANYDWGMGVASLSAMVPVIRAQLLMVLGRFEEASRLFEDHLDRARKEGMAYRSARLLADRAWCHVRAGRVSQALADAKAAEASAADQPDADDRAAAYARLARIHRHGGRDGVADQLQARADDALAQHDTERACTRDLLDRTLAALAPT